MKIELSGTSRTECPAVLERICNHLGKNLEEMVIIILDIHSALMGRNEISRFAEEKMRQGINICHVGNGSFVSSGFDFWAATIDTRVFKFIRRTVADEGNIRRGGYFGIYGLPGLCTPNFLEKVANVVEYSHLETNIKLKGMDSMHCLRRWNRLVLLNQEPIEDEEVLTMNAILATIEANPRSSPRTIQLPKVSS